MHRSVEKLIEQIVEADLFRRQRLIKFYQTQKPQMNRVDILV